MYHLDNENHSLNDGLSKALSIYDQLVASNEITNVQTIPKNDDELKWVIEAAWNKVSNKLSLEGVEPTEMVKAQFVQELDIRWGQKHIGIEDLSY